MTQMDQSSGKTVSQLKNISPHNPTKTANMDKNMDGWQLGGWRLTLGYTVVNLYRVFVHAITLYFMDQMIDSW